jgi:hypothetical protein
MTLYPLREAASQQIKGCGHLEFKSGLSYLLATF